VTRAKRSDLAPWRPGAVLQELVSHTALYAVAWYGGLGYIGLLLMLALELVVVNLLSTVVYPERGVLRHLRDLVLFLPLMAFLLFFVLVTYGVARKDELVGAAADSPFGLLQLDLDLLRWTAIYTVLHLGAMLVYARTRPQPRLEWARLALTLGAVTFIAIFVLIFVVAFLGAPAVEAVRWLVGTDVPGDRVLCAIAVLVRLGFALLMSRMPEHDLKQIAAQPYSH
jgi:hypothetical protein